MTKEQIKEFSKKLSADGNEFIMLVLCDGDLVTQMDGTYFGLSVFLAGAALNDDTFKQVFEDAVKFYEKGKENVKEKQPNI